jgi:hypothetical protein
MCCFCTAVVRIQHCRHLEQLSQIKALLPLKRLETPTHRHGVTPEISPQFYMSSEKRLCLGSNVGRPANSLVSAVQQSEPTAILQQIYGTSFASHFLLRSSDVAKRQLSLDRLSVF